jgi:hypothetical protein
MGDLVGTTDAAAKLGITSGRLRVLCREGRVPGAKCVFGRWYVPKTFKITPGTRGPKFGK